MELRALNGAHLWGQERHKRTLEQFSYFLEILERAEGIEPSSSVWKTEVLTITQRPPLKLDIEQGPWSVKIHLAKNFGSALKSFEYPHAALLRSIAVGFDARLVAGFTHFRHNFALPLY